MQDFFIRLLRSLYKKLPRGIQMLSEKKMTFWQTVKFYRKELAHVMIICIAILIFIPIATYFYFIRDISSKDRILNRSNTGLTLLDRDGNPFFHFYESKTITPVSLSEIPTDMQHAVISIEDRNFYTNQGVSFESIIRALIANVTAGQIQQGGSTISQELVKNALLNSRRSILRKYQEAVLAYDLNRRYSKNDILEIYLNSVYFGEGAYGVENAAQAYFGKDAKDLDLAESSMLAGLLPAPSAYSPLSNDPSLAKKRQTLVLSAMLRDHYITDTQRTQALSEKFVFNPKKEVTNNLATHFAIYVKDQLVKKYGENQVIQSGFRVTTTLNSDWQKYAEQVVKNQVSALRYNNASNGAAIAMDPKTGEVEAMVGSIDWENTEFGKTNMAITPRQPGSSFKPIVYGYALENRLITTDTVLKDDPITFQDGYKPLDYDKRFRGPVTVRRALSNSLNIPAVEVMEKVGVENATDFAKSLGITTLTDPNRYGLSLVLGAAEVPLLEMTDVYATFADKGDYHKPVEIIEVRNKYNELIDKTSISSRNVLSDATSFLISSILSDNATRAEEFGNALNISRPAAVKTGTTENFRDALTIGYTPSLVVGVWVGNNDNSPMDNIAGSLGAAPIWRLLMERFLAGTPVENFIQPFSVVRQLSCPYKGTKDTKLATGSASMEFYIRGTEPSTPCENTTPTASPHPTETPGPSATGTPIPSDTPAPSNTPAPTSIPVPTSIIPILQTPTPTP